MSSSKNYDYQLAINYVAVVYAFVLPLSRAGISFFTGLLILLFLLDGNITNKLKKVFKNRIILALTAFIGLNFISLLWSDHLQDSLGYIRRYWYLLPIIVLSVNIKKEFVPKVLSAFIFGMFISEIIAYGIFFHFWPFNDATYENPSPFMHHIEYSIFLAFTALVLLGRIFNEEHIKYKFLYAFFFITISGNLFLIAGRTGQLAFVLGLLVLTLVSFKNKWKGLLISLGLAVMIIGAAYNMSNTFNKRIHTAKQDLVNVVEKKDYCTSWGGRVGAWIISKDIIKQSPLVGAGIVDNMKEFHRLIDTQYPEKKCMQALFMHTHNQYLQIFTQLGVIGLVIFLSIFYVTFKLSIKAREYRNIKYIYLTVLLFAFVSEVVFHRQFSMALFALIIGLLLAQYRVENEVSDIK